MEWKSTRAQRGAMPALQQALLLVSLHQAGHVPVGHVRGHLMHQEGPLDQMGLVMVAGLQPALGSDLMMEDFVWQGLNAQASVCYRTTRKSHHRHHHHRRNHHHPRHHRNRNLDCEYVQG